MATRLVKRAGEVRQYTFDFSLLPEITAGDTLAGTPVVTATNVNPSGSGAAPSVTSIAIAVGNKTVTCTISAGSDGSTWRMECSCGTAAGSTLVCTGLLLITED